MSNIFWITAQSGSGKSELAFAALKKFKNIVVLDGDQMRATVCQNLGLTYEGRRENNLRIARLAGLLAGQGHPVIVSVIAPFKDVRKEIDEICKPFWIWLVRELPKRENYPYEEPEKPDLIIYNHEGRLEDTIEQFLEFLKKTPYYFPSAPAPGNA